MTPTIGRIVHYTYGAQLVVFAAIVLAVDDDGFCTLDVRGNGSDVPPFIVPRAPQAEKPTKGHWCYPAGSISAPVARKPSPKR